MPGWCFFRIEISPREMHLIRFMFNEGGLRLKKKTVVVR